MSEDRKDNISTILLLPCIGISERLVMQYSEFGFVNSYLFWDKKTYPFDVIYLVFKPREYTVGLQHFVAHMQKNQNYLEIVDVDGTVVMVYSIPKRFKNDYRLFLKGKYSKTSKEFKECFPMKQYKVDEKGKVIREESEHTSFYHIFNKTEELRQRWQETLGENTEIPEGSELYDKYDTTKETLIL